jgi:DNA-binding transcriptional ArsR family regulator
MVARSTRRWVTIPWRNGVIPVELADERNLFVTLVQVKLDALPGDPFDALGDPNRRAIVELMRESDRSVGELAAALPISRPAVSRHLRLLEEAGLVRGRVDGTRHIYRLDDEGIAALREYLEGVWGVAAARFRLAAGNTAPRTRGDG